MNIKEILKQNKKSVTADRLEMFEYMTKHHIFSASDILTGVNSIWRTSAFRIIKLFLELGVIRRVQVGERQETYELNDHSHHHEHMKCETCCSIISFASQDICAKLFEEAKKIWFEIKEHTIGIYGKCSKCR